MVNTVKNSLMLKQSATEAFKTDSKRGFQIRAEATGDFIGNKIANKITEVSKKNHYKMRMIKK